MLKGKRVADVQNRRWESESIASNATFRVVRVCVCERFRSSRNGGGEVKPFIDLYPGSATTYPTAPSSIALGWDQGQGTW